MSTAHAPLPAAPCLRIPEGNAPYLEAMRCGACNALYLTPRMACSRCGKRDDLHPQRLADRARYTALPLSTVFPGVETPFISAIVDLDGGGTLKGNLRGLEPPRDRCLGMAVKVVIGDALGRRDKDGNAYLAYFFEPAEEPSA